MTVRHSWSLFAEGQRTLLPLGGVFAQRGHSARTAPIITVVIQVTTLKTTPTCGIMHN